MSDDIPIEDVRDFAKRCLERHKIIFDRLANL